MSATLGERIREQLEADPSHAAVAFVDGRGRFEWLSRAEFTAHASRAARALAERGVDAGHACVFVSVDPRECATLVLAALLRGAVPLLVAPPAIQGVNSSLRAVVLDVVKRTGARLAVLPKGMERDADELASAAPGAELEYGCARLLEASEPLDAFAARDPGDVAALQLTSGTTGFPRIAVWEERRVVAALDGMARGMGLRRDEDVYLNWTPLYHDMGLVNNFLLCQVRGIPLALLSPLDVVRKPALWLRALTDTGAKTTWSPNFGFALAAERVGDDELEGVDLSRVRGFWNAAERVHAETLERFFQRFERCGLRRDALKANFGCVETIGGVTFTRPTESPVVERVDSDALQERGLALEAPQSEDTRTQTLVSTGRAYPGVDVCAFDADGAYLPDGAVGELGFRLEGRFTEYLGQPDETARSLRGDWVFPGDLGYLRDGEVFWTGRARERINLQGKKLDPSELERALLATEGLRKGCFVAFGVEDEERGTEVLVVIAEVEPTHAGTCPDVAAAARRDVSLGLGVTIEELVLVSKGELTKTSSGKRRHRHFRELWLAGELEVLYRTGAGRIG